MSDEKAISKGPKKRDPTCFQLVHPILIPAGTILRQAPGKPGEFLAPAGYGNFSVSLKSAEQHSGTYRKVIA